MIELQRFHDGDTEYFAELMESHGGVTRWMAGQFAHDNDELDDLCQEIWIHIWENRVSFSGRAPFRSWLLVVARNVCRSWARWDKRRRAREARAVDDRTAPPNPLDLVVTDEGNRAILKAIVKLPPRQREVMMFRKNDHLSSKQVAEAMGISPVTVRTLFRRALLNLRRDLEDPR